MQFNVAQFLKESPGASRRYDLLADVSFIEEEVKAVRPLSGSVEFMRSSGGILVTGQLETEVEVVCSRCLEPFLLPIKVKLEEEFRPTVDVVTGAKLKKTASGVSISDEDKATLIDEHHVLDLSEVVRQDILLAIPMRPLCRPNCAGMCPHCGHNLNEGPCGCREEAIDPRWAVLGRLKDIS